VFLEFTVQKSGAVADQRLLLHVLLLSSHPSGVEFIAVSEHVQKEDAVKVHALLNGKTFTPSAKKSSPVTSKFKGFVQYPTRSVPQVFEYLHKTQLLYQDEVAQELFKELNVQQYTDDEVHALFHSQWKAFHACSRKIVEHLVGTVVWTLELDITSSKSGAQSRVKFEDFWSHDFKNMSHLVQLRKPLSAQEQEVAHKFRETMQSVCKHKSCTGKEPHKSATPAPRAADDGGSSAAASRYLDVRVCEREEGVISVF
jgi:hypothetical protein